MEKTRFFKIPEIIALSALIIQILTAVLGENVNWDIIDMFGIVEWNEGHDGGGSLIKIFYLFLPPAYLLTFFALFVKKYNFIFYLLSGIIMLLPAAVMLFAGFGNEGIDYVFFFTLPCLLIMSSAVVSGIDRKKQIQEYKIKRC